jgi:hypothetical protein
MHFLIAFSSRIIDLFQPGDYMKSFVDNPERYIHAANLFMNVLISLVLFICGIYTKKYTGSYFAGLLMQLSPFGSSALWGVSGRLIPEAIMMIPLLLTGLMIIKYIYDEDRATRPLTYIVLFAMITGFGIACKLSFIPIILIPLVLLQVSSRQRITIILYTLLFFIIFAYPVIFNFHDYWNWVSGIFTHSGKYGGGEKNIVNLASVPGNIKYLFAFNRELFYVAFTSLIMGIIFSFRYLKNHSFLSSRVVRAIFAVNVAILVCVIFTLKHFELYYFMPFAIFKYLLVLLSALLFFRLDWISKSKIYKMIALISVSGLVLYMTYGQIVEIRAAIDHYTKRDIQFQQDAAKILSLVDRDKPIIIAGPYYGTPFIEFAHFNGFLMSARLKGFYTGYLKEKFPGSYHYVTWSDKFDYWDEFVDMKQILEKTPSSLYIYIGKERGADLAEIERRLAQIPENDSFTKKVLYQDAGSGEKLIEVIKN